jgi:hypothetical protein
MIARLVHHAEILSLKGNSYRLRGKDLGARPYAEPAEIACPITRDDRAEHSSSWPHRHDVSQSGFSPGTPMIPR